ncbi:DEHA2G25036p [Debaryomyces hansenii CBS767]|uniref:DEHA2G25036p n=1 Tax=Debaryomyces hansenii (strain ATCC 36239 / CBS 767 / BCRC 21394 / JCM 1990 / NBRC 0083 / IGC 2968) TaxID=284592 RepID=Q6BGN4_DEBHA|nr:DEHA2G25036p [Debaryomyces hansenii CBS767]CAG91156.2 DEHA2G25036p [Debaryomyces hansenii CBS767]|eukprot:XP_462637.2 DEHA2G25036p [Debaryomyces hansenii CBS767]
MSQTYSCEKLAYEKLSNNFLFNSVYIDRKFAFGTFNIGKHYHALGPFLIQKYIDQGKENIRSKEKKNMIDCPKIKRRTKSPKSNWKQFTVSE